LFEVTDTVASYRWDTRSVEAHLRSLSAAMLDEVDHLLASAPGPTGQPEGDGVASAHDREALGSRVNGASEAQQ
jgi:hypothetical protein